MILATRHAGNVPVEQRTEWGSSAIPAPGRTGYSSAAGQRINLDTVFGLPAVAAAISGLAEVIASLTIQVFQGVDDTRRRRPETDQQRLLDDPCIDLTRFDVLSDIVTGVESCGNSFNQKIRDRNGKVTELYPVDPDYVRVYRDPRTGEKLFDVRVVDGTGSSIATMSAKDILHIRGFTPRGGLAGLSRITMHRDPLGSQIARQRFEGRHFANNAVPGVVLAFPANITSERANEWKNVWDAAHAGAENAGSTSVIGGGATVTQLPISLADAQFVEGKNMGVYEVAQMFRVDPEFIFAHVAAKQQATSEQIGLRMLAYSVGPRLRRITDALRHDQDLFPVRLGLYPEFDAKHFVAIDAATKATVQKEQVQSGLRLVDELRAEDGYGPLPPVPKDWTLEPGKVPQITPVGGAPNPTMDTGLPADEQPTDTSTASA